MGRSALVRSASLAPDEAELADLLAARLADGGCTGLLRQYLVVFGQPIRRRLEELDAAGLDPSERLVLVHPSTPATTPDVQAFYAGSDWPAAGPAGQRQSQ